MDSASYRSDIHPCQIYTRLTRKEYNAGIEASRQLLSSKTILRVEHRPKANLPKYTAHYLQYFFNNFGKVEAVIPLSDNVHLVMFSDEHTARQVNSKQHLGAPNGRLLTRMWSGTQNLRLMYSVVGGLETSSETRRRFSSLMDRDDFRAASNVNRYLSRFVVASLKSRGHSAKTFFCPKQRKIRTNRDVGVVEVHYKHEH